MCFMKIRFLLICFAGACVLPLQAQYAISWYKVAGGGGASSGGGFALSGTVGQPDAGGVLTGGNYSLAGGFWALAAVQTPGAPLLQIQLTGTNTVLLSWPSPSTGFKLQQTPSLAPPAWVDNGQAYTDDGVRKSIVINPPVNNWFFRLKSP